MIDRREPGWLLLIVAQEETDLHERLAAQFVRYPEVEVILERRRGDRRGGRHTVDVERRQVERRRLWGRVLRGYAVVRIARAMHDVEAAAV